MFPAVELRTAFAKPDVMHIANLCHDCRSCFYACMYAAPHEFAVNIPQVLSAVRVETYREHAWPGGLSRLFGGGVGQGAMGWIVGTVAMVALTVAVGDPRAALAEQRGDGAFYRVLPYAALVVSFLALGVFVLVAMAASLATYWRQIARSGRGAGIGAIAGAAWDALTLRYLGGGDDEGCDYPSALPSRSRRVLHALVFWGFLAAFAATVAAAAMQDLLGLMPPYPLASPPVVLGSLGGMAMIAGAAGLLAIKWRADVRPAVARMLAWDYAFLASIEVVSITGMLLLLLRDTAALGTLMLLHLGSVVAFFLAMPYGKFVHFLYRYAALVRDRADASAAAGTARVSD